MDAIAVELERLRATLDASDRAMPADKLERLLALCARANVEYAAAFPARITAGKAAIAGTCATYGLVRTSGTGERSVTYTAYVCAAQPGERMRQRTVTVRSSCEWRAEADACTWFRRRGYRVDHVIAVVSRGGRTAGSGMSLERVM